MKILLTGAGSAIARGIAKSIKLCNEKIKFIGMEQDIFKRNEIFYKVIFCPMDVKDDNYVDYLIDVINNENIDIFWPTINGEIKVISKRKSFIEKNTNCRVIVNDYESLINAYDKGKLYNNLQESFSDIIPKYYLVDTYDQLIKAIYNLGYPEKKVCLKKTNGAGSRGFRIVINEYDKIKYLLETQNKGIYIDILELEVLKPCMNLGLMVMEYLEGKEYDVDTLSSEDTSFEVVRFNLEMDHGSSVVTKVVRNRMLENYANKIVRYLKLKYINSLTFIIKENRPYLLEINTRVPASIIATTNAGVNMPYLALQILMGEIELTNLFIKKNIITSKFLEDYYFDEVDIKQLEVDLYEVYERKLKRKN